MSKILSLELNGKTYTTIPKGRSVRSAMEFYSSVKDKGEDIDVKDLDEMMHYVVELYGNKFTVDDMYDNIDADKLMKVIMDNILGVVNMFSGKSDPNA